MGRPIKKVNFGDTATTGQQIVCTAWVPGDSQARVGYIVRQKGSHAYLVDTTGAGGLVGKCSLVDTTASAAGQMTIKVYPYGVAQGTGAAASLTLRGKTIAVNAGGTGYSVGNTVTVTGGTGTSITATVATVNAGAVTGLTFVNLGSYTVLPSVTGAATTVAPSGGTGLTVNLTFEINTFTVSAGGVDYLSPVFTPSAGAATASFTVVDGVITAMAPVNRGTYTVKPTFTITDSGSASVEYASKINQNLVATYEGGYYDWKPQLTTIVAGQANIQTA